MSFYSAAVYFILSISVYLNNITIVCLIRLRVKVIFWLTALILFRLTNLIWDMRWLLSLMMNYLHWPFLNLFIRMPRVVGVTLCLRTIWGSWTIRVYLLLRLVRMSRCEYMRIFIILMHKIWRYVWLQLLWNKFLLMTWIGFVHCFNIGTCCTWLLVFTDLTWLEIARH